MRLHVSVPNLLCLRATSTPPLLNHCSFSTPLLPSVRALQVVEVGVGYQAKIESLWQGYESKKEQEAALLAKSEAILAGLVGDRQPLRTLRVRFQPPANRQPTVLHLHAACCAESTRMCACAAECVQPLPLHVRPDHPRTAAAPCAAGGARGGGASGAGERC